MFERFSADARAVVEGAQGEARRLGHRHIGTEHLLLGLLDRPVSTAAALLVERGLDKQAAERTVRRLGVPGLDPDALGTIGIDLDAVRERVEATFGPGALDRPAARGRRPTRHLPFTRRAKKSLELALREALRLGHSYIGDGHLLLGLLRDADGLAARTVAAAGLDRDELRAALEAAIPADPRSSAG